VASVLGQAEAAVAAGRLDQAATHYDEALKLDPQNAKASAGKATVLASLVSLRKNFVAGRTSFIGKAKKGPAGFDDNEPADPDYQGRIDYEFEPANVKPGDSHSAKIYLVNEGKRPIKLTSMTVTTIANGQRSGGPSNPQAKEVAPGQRAMLATVGGAWKEGTNTWALEVVVQSGRGETYSSRANWR
jgi:tetratricopeptide (TPR) repeat protein